MFFPFDILYNRYYYFANNITRSFWPDNAATVLFAVTLSLFLTGMSDLYDQSFHSQITGMIFPWIWGGSSVFSFSRYLFFPGYYHKNEKRINQSRYRMLFGMITIAFATAAFTLTIYIRITK